MELYQPRDTCQLLQMFIVEAIKKLDAAHRLENTRVSRATHNLICS
jgi:hypothetical protein